MTLHNSMFSLRVDPCFYRHSHVFSRGSGAIGVALLSVIRRRHLRELLSIRDICPGTAIFHSTIRKHLRAGCVEPKFNVPQSKLDPFADRISAWLMMESNSPQWKTSPIYSVRPDRPYEGSRAPRSDAGVRRNRRTVHAT